MSGSVRAGMRRIFMIGLPPGLKPSSIRVVSQIYNF
jgi:hypothetical protein